MAQPYGIIQRADQTRTGARPPDDLEAYGCTLRFYDYRAALARESHAAIRTCLERAVALHPIMRPPGRCCPCCYLDEDRFGFNSRTGGVKRDRSASLEAARRAIRLDPENVRALQALMMALFFAEQPAEALQVGERAVALNPNDTELLGEFGARLGQAGAWERGAELLEQALARNPGHSGYYSGILAVYAYMQHDYARAESLIRQAAWRSSPSTISSPPSSMPSSARHRRPPRPETRSCRCARPSSSLGRGDGQAELPAGGCGPSCRGRPQGRFSGAGGRGGRRIAREAISR